MTPYGKKYDGPVTWNNCSRNIYDNNFYNVGIVKLKIFLRTYVIRKH